MAEQKIPTSHGMLTPTEIIGDLIYISYRFNRQEAPDTPVKNWECVFGKKVYELEKVYQQEIVKA